MLTWVLANWRLVLAAGLVLLLAGTGLYIRALRSDVAAARLTVAAALDREARTATALDQLQRAQAAAQAALQTAEIARQEAETDADLLRRRIAAAPRSRACADSPAIRGLLDAIRPAPAGDRP